MEYANPEPWNKVKRHMPPLLEKKNKEMIALLGIG